MEPYTVGGRHRNVQIHADSADPRDIKIMTDSGEVIEGVVYLSVTALPDSPIEATIELRPQSVRISGQLYVSANCPNCSLSSPQHVCMEGKEEW